MPGLFGNGAGVGAVRRAARTDAAQSPLVTDLERLGFSVCLLFRVGEGVPDALVAKNGVDILVEIKNGPKDKLTTAEKTFHAEWKGAPVLIAYNAEMVLDE